MIKTLLWIIGIFAGYLAFILALGKFLALSSEDWDRINKEYRDDHC